MSAEAKLMKFPEKSPYHPDTARNILQSWPEFSRGLSDPAWLAAMRQRGIEYLLTHGLPTAQLEGWKYTNILPLVAEYGASQGKAQVTSNDLPGVAIERLTTSAIEHKWVQELLDEKMPSGDANADVALWHLSNIFFRDGVSVDVPANMTIAEPLRVLLQCTGGSFYAIHTAIRLGANARLTMIEDHRGEGAYWKNRLSHITLGPGAHFTHVRIQEDSMDAVYTQTTNVSISKDATYDAAALYTGAALSRNQVRTVLKEPGAACHINSVSLMRGKQHTDTTVLAEHVAPHCRSNQNIRTILDDRARGVFQGKVHVHQPAQKTDAYQLSRGLLLSPEAQMDTKPELEIYADDVKCSHGATTGKLEDEPLFYMRSRGIDDAQARALLIQAFAGQVFDEMKDETIRDMLRQKVQAWLG